MLSHEQHSAQAFLIERTAWKVSVCMPTSLSQSATGNSSFVLMFSNPRPPQQHTSSPDPRCDADIPFCSDLGTLLLCACVLSHLSPVRLSATLWTVARQAPLSMGFSRQEYWSGWPCPPPGDLPYARIEPPSLVAPALQEASLPLSH